jgi:hypothetical protein
MKMKNLLRMTVLSIAFAIISVVSMGQGLETFSNLTLSGTSYANGTFLGQDGSTWTYVQCRGDYAITDKAIMIGRSRTPQSNFYSGTISGGIGVLSFKYSQAFTNNVNLNVLINDVVVGNVTSSAEQGVIKNSGEITVNISGDFVIKFINVNNSDGQVVVDDITWTGYSSGGNQNPVISNITQNPAQLIQSSTTVSVSANVTDSDGTVEMVELRWGKAADELENTINMTHQGGGVYTTTSSIPAHYNGTTIYYAVYAEDNEGGSALSATQSYLVSPIVYFETFDVGLGDCQTYSVSGDLNWIYGTFGGNGYALMNGWGSSGLEEDWLILPGFDLTTNNEYILSFESAYHHGIEDEYNYLKLFYSTDYSGTGTPEDATWTELNFTKPSTDNYTWEPSGEINLPQIQGTIWVAFKYHYSSDYRRWQVDNIKLEKKTYTVNFNVVDVTMPKVSDPINTAAINFYGTQKLTNEMGEAVYTWVETEDNIPYAVTKSGYHNFVGTLNVANNNLIQQVKMLSSKVAINISADPDANTANISWVGSGAEVYRIRYRVVGSSSYLYLNVPSSPANINVFPDTNYEVTVSSKIDGAWSNYSNPTTFTTLSGSQIVASNITVTGITSSSATINWVGSGADQYRIRYNITGTTSYQYLNSLSSPTVIPVFPESSYDVSVASMVGGLWMAYTTPVRFETPTGAQASNVTITNITAYTAQVNWNGSGADRYRIMYRIESSSSYNYIDTYFSPRTISVLPETTYEVRVASRVAGVWYPYTAPVKFTTPALVPKDSPANNLENAMLSNLLLYPNPANGYVNVQVSLNQTSDITISVFDIRGSLVKMEKLYNQFGNIDTRIDLDGFSKGMYIVRVVSMEQVESIRLMVQ